MNKTKNLLKDFGLILIFLALVLVLAVISGGAFVKPGNLISVLKQTAVNGILAMGMTFVILSGGIDLSVGSTIGLTGVVACMLAHPAVAGEAAGPGQFPLIVSVLAALLVGALIGAVNGIGIAYGAIPPFIVTLGTMTIVRGLALIISGGSPVFDVTASFEAIASIKLGQIPILAVYLVIVVAVCAFVLQKTVFGRRIYAIGGNRTAAEVSGIRVKRYYVAVYTIAGLLAGACGLLTASRTITGAPTAGASYEMDAIAAVVIGGVSMSGGSGKWHGVVIGALMIAVIANGLDIMRVDSNWQPVIKGLIIIFAVLMDIRSKNRKS